MDSLKQFRLRFVCQFKTERMWSDEFWSYDPHSFQRAYLKYQRSEKHRAVLRVIEEKTFEQIKKEQGKG